MRDAFGFLHEYAKFIENTHKYNINTILHLHSIMDMCIICPYFPIMYGETIK